ncbi:MAG: hypothetical protein M3Q68_08950 [Actinomycetota bacterium]|nr:hypothetical protein [Actinomycetota bacterium]
MADYTVKVVDRAGVVIKTLDDANVLSIVEEVNKTGSCRFTFPKHDPATNVGQGAAVDLLEREVQVWRTGDTVPLFWGVLVDADTSSSSAEVSVTAPDLSWYFTRRFVDRPRTNYISNPGFEGGSLTGWSTFGGATATAVTSPRRLGSHAVQIVGTVTGADAGLRTTFSVTGLAGIGTNVYIAGHFQLTAWTGGATGNLSMRVRVYNAALALVASRETQLGDGDELVSVDGWLREELDPSTPVHVNAGETWSFQLDLMAPNGTIVWDALQAVIPESLSDYDQDIAVLMGAIVTDVQDVTDKSNLNIGVSTPASGVTIPVYALQYTEHTPADTAIDELASRDDAPDWYIATTSTVRTFTTAFPQLGSDLSASTTLSLTTNVASYSSYRVSGAVTENHVTYFGPGDGPDREEGYAVDTSAVGGLVLQGVYQASPTATVDMLEPLAAGQLAAKNKLGRFLTVTTIPSNSIVDTIGLGDTVAVSISDGWAQASGNWRVVRREHFPRTQNLSLTLVEA